MAIRRFGIACLISAVMALSAAATPAFAAGTYTWSLSCRGNDGANVVWYWLQNGQLIAGSDTSIACSGNDKLSGSGAVPPGATAVYAELNVDAWGAGDFQSETIALDATGSFSVSLQGSAKWRGDVCEHPSCNVIQSYHESATFKMS